MSCLGQKYKRCQISSPAVKTQELKNQRPHFNPQDHGLEKLQSNSDFWFKLKQLKITKSDNLLLNEHKFLLFYSSETTLIADCRKLVFAPTASKSHSCEILILRNPLEILR